MCRVKRRHDITKTKLQQIGFSDNRVCVHACVPMCAVKNWGWSRLWFEEPQLHTHMGFHWYFARVCKQRLTDVISTHLENVLSLSGHIGQTHPPKHLSQSALIFSLSLHFIIHVSGEHSRVWRQTSHTKVRLDFWLLNLTWWMWIAWHAILFITASSIWPT